MSMLTTLIPKVTCVDVSDAGLGGAGKAQQGSVVGPHDLRRNAAGARTSQMRQHK